MCLHRGSAPPVMVVSHAKHRRLGATWRRTMHGGPSEILPVSCHVMPKKAARTHRQGPPSRQTCARNESGEVRGCATANWTSGPLAWEARRARPGAFGIDLAIVWSVV